MKTPESGNPGGESPDLGAPGRRRIYLVRHGDVDYFDAAGRPVRPDTVSLNAAGAGQAELLRHLLAGVRLDRVIASGLPRTVETAEAIVRGRGLAIETHAALQEIRPGRLPDLAGADLERHFLGAFSPSIDRSTRFLGGETFGEFLDRVLPSFRALLQESGWQTLLLVAHGGVNRAILLETLGSGLERFAAIEQDPGALNILDFDGDAGDGAEGVAGLVRLVNFTPGAPAKEGLWLTTMERLFQQYRPL